MKVSYRWLSEYVDIPMNAAELASRLTLRGVAVEEVCGLNRGIQGVVSGRILSIEPHPDADRLVVCRVDVGYAPVPGHDGGLLTIVTGAPNLHPGDVVPVALPGAALPGGWKIDATDFRGVYSQGMLCSETELLEGLPHKETEGVWVLPPDTPPGRSMVDLLELDDQVLVLDLTPNYASHCLSMVGVAREVAALTGGTVRLPSPPASTSMGELSEKVQVSIEDPSLCRRYSARMLKVTRSGPSPLWMQNRLRAAGMRPISALVDITNYVMLELGQPLHAFDYDRLGGHRIVVRRARPGETLVTLDGQERRLEPDMLVIADAERPKALAGVMGGLDSEVREGAAGAGAAGGAPAAVDGTRTILLESASFDNRSVRRTSRRLGLASEAGARFIKGTDVNGTVLAADRACELAASLGAAQPLDGALDVYPEVQPPRLIPLRPARVNALLGLSLTEPDMVHGLGRLGLTAHSAADVASGAALRSLNQASPRPLDADAIRAWDASLIRQVEEADALAARGGPWAGALYVVAPTRRPDLAQEVDLVEEVARVDGYDQIPATLPMGRVTAGGRTRPQELGVQAREALLGAGYTQVISYSFQSEREADRLRLPADHPWRRQLRIQNPVAEDFAVMRTTTLTSLLGVLEHNQAWRQGDVQVFTLGAVYQPKSLPVTELPEERAKLGLAAAGLRQAKRWNQPERAVGFFDLKGVVETLLDTLGFPRAEFRPSAHPFLHPGRQADVLVGGRTLGLIGESHPRVQAAYDLPNRVVLAELDWEALVDLADTGRHYRPLGRYPAVVRDVALILPTTVPAAQVLSVIERSGGDLLQDVRLFDVYEGASIGAGRRSLAYSLTYRAEDRTLTEAEVEEAHNRVRQSLADQLGAELRS
ncbi:MAG: phenylalanine--tRNA ligase subunit beta [Bacillota bacterium]